MYWTPFVDSVFGVKLCYPFMDNRISGSGSRLDLTVIMELRETYRNVYVQFSCFSHSLKNTTR